VGTGGTTLTSLTLGGNSVPFTRTTIKGVEYAMFQAALGEYTATYGTAATAEIQSAATVASTPSEVTLTVAGGSGSTVEVAYGTSSTGLSHRKVDAVQARVHAVRLTGLKPSTTYRYRVLVKSPSGAVKASAISTVTTAPADTAAPKISARDVYALPDGTAAVSWRTDEATDATLLIGRSPTALKRYRGASAELRHTVVATRLKPATTYYYRVKSVDSSGNARVWPALGVAPARFVTPDAGVADRTAVLFRTGVMSADLEVRKDGLGGVSLAKGSAKGTFLSRILDAEQMVSWGRMAHRAELPGDSSIVLSVRTGSTRKPDATWTAWKRVPQGGSIGSTSRYVQYRVEFSAASSGLSPVLRGVGITHGGIPPVVRGEVPTGEVG
jgi:hypothetical protein